ncbi:reverse transcriptase domain-containing protein [Tanacetum coccineum]
MTQLLVKDAPFNFSKECFQAFDKLKHELTHALIMIKPDLALPFEVMCDTSDYAVGALLGKRIDKHFIQTHTLRQAKYERSTKRITLHREGTFGCRRRISTNSDNTLSNPRLICFHSITLPYGVENLIADHLSRLENPDLGKSIKAKIRDLFPEERLMAVSYKNNEPWMSHFYSSSMLTESYEGASSEIRQHKSFDNVTVAHQEGIMVSPLQREKSLKPGSTSQIFSLTHVDWSKFVMHVKEPEISPREMRHLKSIYKSMKYLMFGE